MTMLSGADVAAIKALELWQGEIAIEPLSGGLTNRNFAVEDQSGRYVVRLGRDIPIHGVMRFNEASAATAAFKAGVSPEVLHARDGIMVSRFVNGRTFTPEDFRNEHALRKAVALMHRYHRGMLESHTGPVLAFWVFQVIRSYINLLARGSTHINAHLGRLAANCRTLEEAVGPVEIVFGHNDLLAANFIDDGERLWLLDWDYAGLNSPLFDLANLSANNGLGTAQDEWLLGTYLGATPTARHITSFKAMKCASLLREALWSAISETHSDIDFDYRAYTEDYLGRFEREMAAAR